jgi:hypothetical protein
MRKVFVSCPGVLDTLPPVELKEAEVPYGREWGSKSGPEG